MKLAIKALGIIPLIWLLSWVHHLITYPFHEEYIWNWPWYAQFFPLNLTLILVVAIYVCWVIHLLAKEGTQ